MIRLAPSVGTALPATAVALALLASASHATPVEDVTAVLDSPDFTGVSYGEIVETDGGGVEIRDLHVTATALRAMGAMGQLDAWQEPSAPVTPDMEPAVIHIDAVTLGEGTLAMIFGATDYGAPESIALGLDGFRIDLEALSDVPSIAMLQQYIGGAAELAGWAELQIDVTTPDRYDITATLDLGFGRFDMDIGFDESEGLPRGELRFTDTAGRSLAGLMAYVQRIPVEMTLELANASLQDMREHPSGNPEAEDPIIALIEAEAEAAEAMLERFPADGPAAADAMAAWAEEMAAALPAHADFFAAIGLFATTSGTLHLYLAAADGAAVPMDAAFELPFYSDAGLFAETLEALGITAEFEAAR